MSLPKPSKSLTGSCSVIFNNTLYSFSPKGFQSLALEEGAEWKALPDGESVEGGVCVGSTPKDSSKAGLFIVGGMSSSPDHTGFQKFTYSTGKWETLSPDTLVTRNRTWHSAAYINASDSIMVYSGSTDGAPNLSSQTFTVGASEPYSVLAFQSTISPPGVAPILLPWSETQVAIIGGNPTNMKVMLFDPNSSWAESGVTLAEPLPKNSTLVKAAIVPGDDGSKHLYTFDPSTSPNTVNRTVLLGANGAPMANAAPVKTIVASREVTGSEEVDVRKRELTVDNWPKYNSSLAPQSIRDTYSLATDSNGLVVMSGGNDDEALSIFDAKENDWKDATAIFGKQESFSIESSPSASSSSSSASSTATSSTPPPASSAIAAPTAASKSSDDSDGALPPTTLLGVVLGTIFGVAIILLIILFMIKRARKQRQPMEVGNAQKDSDLPDEKSYFDRDIPKPSGGHFQGHAQQDSAGSFSSMAILMGKAQKPAIQRKASHDTKRSSVSSILNSQFKRTIGRPQPPQEFEPPPDYLADEKGVSFAADTNQPKPRPGPPVDQNGETRRSSGWNRYWSGGSALGILGFGQNGNNSRRETAGSEQSGSHYSSMNHRVTQDSATVPPLYVEGRPEFYRVNSGSPTISQYDPKVKEQSGTIERPVSNTSSSGYSSGIPASVNDNWDPSMVKPWGYERAPSSTYSTGTYPTALGAPSATRAPTGVSKQPQLTKASTSDLSWLNLGDNPRRG
ncbi:hypothetical protein F4779DRAFT_394927 [Xylariaceae sp. FL0662B]|nr:hypothetical protein F4779DRAFT_394927 [Xylariaceae sp. FL0662B]